MKDRQFIIATLIACATLLLALLTGACSIINPPPPPATPTESLPPPTPPILVETTVPTATPTLVSSPTVVNTGPTPTLLPSPTVEAALPKLPPTPPGASAAPPAALCTDLAVGISKTLRVAVVKSDSVQFEDSVSRRQLTGCSITAKGTGATFADPGKVAGDLRTFLTALGWSQDKTYDADGPTGTASGYRQNAALALVSIKWDAAPDAACPKDQPISACNLKPEQKLLAITVNVAQGAALQAQLSSASGTGPMFDDPFAYCEAFGTIDVPDALLLSDRVPDALARAMSRRSPDVPLDMLRKSSFRCVDGKVLGCFTGANIPCASKANLDRTPGPEMVEFCKAQPGADAIPAAVAGRETAYQWRCTNGQPAIERQVLQIDARGYPVEFWQVLTQ